jgi:DNA-3-methyladenine glycosylase I
MSKKSEKIDKHASSSQKKYYLLIFCFWKIFVNHEDYGNKSKYAKLSLLDRNQWVNMIVVGADGKKRCFGGESGREFYGEYHDREWGVPNHDDRHLFEMLILEGVQAGLSWETVLKKREGYRKAFHRFDPRKVASMSDEELLALTQNPAIIRNRLKIFAARQNAQVFLKIQEEFGSFDRYLWDFVKGKSIKSHHHSLKQLPTTSAISDALSKDLKKRGMTFVGSTIIYAFMQAVGMVNDHLIECWCYTR